MNVLDQRRDPDSLLNWTERRIRMRKECPQLGWGDTTVLRVEAPEVLAMRHDFQGTAMLTVHNFSARRQAISVDVRREGGDLLVDVFDGMESRSESGTHPLTVEPYGHHWYHVGAPDNALNRVNH